MLPPPSFRYDIHLISSFPGKIKDRKCDPSGHVIQLRIICFFYFIQFMMTVIIISISSGFDSAIMMVSATRV